MVEAMHRFMITFFSSALGTCALVLLNSRTCQPALLMQDRYFLPTPFSLSLLFASDADFRNKLGA